MQGGVIGNTKINLFEEGDIDAWPKAYTHTKESM